MTPQLAAPDLATEQGADGASTTVGPKRVGLLFVHGIGEQKRFEHLRHSVVEFAELIKANVEGARVSVVDRTEGWPLPPGTPSAHAAPITLSVTIPESAKTAGRHVHFECHEVWWADLGARCGLADTLHFWIWGLGQWSAPIYQHLDQTKTGADEEAGVVMPRSVAGRPVAEPWVRVRLMLAAMAALLTLVTWSLAKRLFQALFGKAPSPTLLVQYIGDVRTYERRAAPGEAPASDPGHPLRVGIRRRMVTEMVAMAAREPSDWFVVAHSLGTVVAYNGLTELGHTLPNYLPETLWKRLEEHFTKRDGTKTRSRLDRMMPSRPDWLDDRDVIDRHALFERLRGVLTYGSPLDKFAAIWPRIVATADDRKGGGRVFRDDCRWINLAAPNDPVAGSLGSFGLTSGDMPLVPQPRNYWTALSLVPGLSHLSYFRWGVGSKEDSSQGESLENDGSKDADLSRKMAVLSWLLGNPPPDLPESKLGWRVVAVLFQYAAVLVFLAAAAVGLATLGAGLAQAFASGKAEQFATLCDFFVALHANIGPTIGVLAAAIALCGHYRWMRESRMNARLAFADEEPEEVGRLLRAQAAASTLLLPFAAVAICVAVLRDLCVSCARPFETLRLPNLEGWNSVFVSAVAIAAAILMQMIINLSLRPKETSNSDAAGRAA